MAKAAKKRPQDDSLASTTRKTIVQQQRKRSKSATNLRFCTSLALIPLLALVYYKYLFSGSNPYVPGFNFLKGEEVPGGSPWRVVDLPGKGKGAIASRHIQKGEWIHSEQPLLVIPDTVKQDEKETYLINQLKTLPVEEQERFYSLANTADVKFGPGKQITDAELAFNIFYTNSMVAAEGTHEGVFASAARINHACSPNAGYYYRDDLGAMTVLALRDISPGEELYFSYFDASAYPKAARQQALRAAYGFQCTCDVCSLGEVESKNSDARRKRIARGAAAFNAWEAGNITSVQAVDVISDALKMMTEEGYWTSLGQHATNAFVIAASHGDVESARAWASFSAKRFAIETGAESDITQEMEKVEENPELAVRWAEKEFTSIPLPPNIDGL